MSKGRRTGRRRPLLLALALAPLLGGALLVRHLNQGWGPLERPRPWRAATGWDRLSRPLRPTATVPLGPDEEPLRLHWLGHAGFLLEWHGTRLLLDPNLSPRCTVSPRLMEPPPALAGGRGLPEVDAALVSHAHYDHLDLPTLEGVAGLPTLVVPAGSEGYADPLHARGTRVVGLEVGEAVRAGALEVIAVPARHHGSRRHPLASRHRAVGYVVRAGGTAVYFAGDTGYGPHFLDVGRRFRPAVAILPIGAYSPAFPIGRVHLSPEQAVQAARNLGESAGTPPPVVVPCHFGTFVLSLDRPDEALPRFARAADEAGVRWIMPALLGAEMEAGDGGAAAALSGGAE